MALEIVVVGDALAYFERAYEPFKTPEGEQAGGVTRRLVIGSDFFDEPTTVRIRTDELAKVCLGLKRGEHIRCTGSRVQGQGRGQELIADTVEIVKAAVHHGSAS